MSLFKYSARNSQGLLIEDTREAQDKHHLIKDLRKEQLYPINIDQLNSVPKKSFKLAFRLKAKNVTLFTRQLSYLLNSGVVLSKALTTLSRQIKDPKISDVIGQIRDQVSQGGYFWQALEEHQDLFSELYINMIRAGELAGNLEAAIENLADFMEKKKNIKEEIISIIIYPVILLLVGAATVSFLMINVVPKMFFIFNDMNQTLPLITKILIGVSSFFSGYWWLILSIIIISFFIVIRLYARENIRIKVTEFIYFFPVISAMNQAFVFSRFSRIMGLALSNGVAIVEAIDISSQAVSNKMVEQKLAKVSSDVSGGLSLSKALAKIELFPPIMIDMIAVGEETGKLDTTMLKAADIYENDLSTSSRRFLSFIEPVLIFLLALIVGFIVMAILLPIFDMNLSIA